MPFTQSQPIKIRDITQKAIGNFYRFCIGENREGKKFYLIIEKKDWHDRFNNKSLSVETTAKRLEQLANEILSYLKKEARFTEWTPTMQEFERKIKEVMGEHAVEFWIIDWVRLVKSVGTKEQVDQAKRIYEWLHGNREWLYK